MWRWACVAALLCAALVQAELNREERSNMPFLLSSRYGRSAPRAMSPRGDKFFMTARYGKRSGLGETLSADAWRPPHCDCRPYRAALIALKAKYRHPEPSRI